MSRLGLYSESWFPLPSVSNPYMRTYPGNLSQNVPARSFAPCPSVAAPEIPLREMGWKIPARQMRQTVRAPQTPLRELGWHALAGMGESAPAAVASTAPIVGTVVTTSIASEAAAGSAMAAWAGPIGAAVGVVIGLIAGFWAAHDARAKGAQTENAAVNSAVTAFDQSMKAIFAAANSSDPTQQISASEAEQLCTQVLQSFWTGMAPYQVGPGRADQSRGGTACGGVSCNKACTAGCCVGCLDIAPSVQSAIGVFQAGGGTATMLEVYGSSYGAVTRPAYSLTYTAPPPPAAPVAAVDSVASALTNLFSPSTPTATTPGATPTTAALTSSSSLSSLLLWGALGFGAFLLIKAVAEMRRLGYFRGLGQDDDAPSIYSVDPGAFTDLPVYGAEDPNPILIPTGTVYGPTPTAATVVQDAQSPGFENPSYVAPGLTVSPSGVVTGPNVATVPTSLAQQVANAVTGILSPTPAPRVGTTPAPATNFFTGSTMIPGLPNLAVLFGGAALLLLVPAMFSGGGGRRRR